MTSGQSSCLKGLTAQHTGPSRRQAFPSLERCSKDKVLAAFKAQEAEKERLRIEQVQREAAIREGCAAQAAECKPFVDKALSVMSELTSQVFVTTKDTLKTIHEETGFERYLIGGSWAAEQIAAAIASVSRR